MKTQASAIICAGALLLPFMQIAPAHAAPSPEEVKRLGNDLTPFGAEKAGNKDGTIPAYTGGLTAPPAGFDKAGAVRPDPFANEKPLFSIDAKNADKYADKLSEGTKALMKLYGDFRIDVYPSYRTVAYPKFVIDNTLKNAARAKMTDDGLGMSGARAGIPFPIPANGNEVMLNFQARYQGLSFQVPKYSAYNVDSNGKLVLSSQGSWTMEYPYYDESRTDEPVVLNRARASYTGPARRAGESLLAMDPVNYADKGRRAWQYLPGQRRVRLAPDIAYDTPNPGTNGMSTYDDVNLFNGKLDRYDFKLVGKKELYIPYNTYRFSYNDKPEDVFQAKFINPSVVRWELHRVWVVEAKLKEGQRHIYSRRTFYVDEDSWTVVASDQYDGRGQLWRAGFAYLNQAYDANAPISTAGHYDLISGSYYINIWPGTGGVKFMSALQPDGAWTPDSLAGQGVR
ncbi:DUF1329 domain-containing protein [Variovorax sp. Sphag1AA]|uniref:DUF1329 domain-containing protein n=1 Tax=Variovorax sp. Sphag1AA TaxID=2587027 RepID=UPI0017C1EE16|nr:DUF1329 domain-containing protein [Variovorax sp. Sphag1AA]MBB3178490.1 hypothetical protein [Variovorax sp. Sphag1AA]